VTSDRLVAAERDRRGHDRVNAHVRTCPDLSACFEARRPIEWRRVKFAEVFAVPPAQGILNPSGDLR
jgi:hypothetical protein